MEFLLTAHIVFLIQSCLQAAKSNLSLHLFHDRRGCGWSAQQLLGHRHRRRAPPHRHRLLRHLLVLHLDGGETKVQEDVLRLAQSGGLGSHSLSTHDLVGHWDPRLLCCCEVPFQTSVPNSLFLVLTNNHFIPRATGGDFEIDATVMLVTSGIGVAVNILMGATLHQHGHGHDDHHDGAGPSSQDVEDDPGQHGHAHVRQNLNVTAAFIHVVGDFIQSIGVFSGAIVIYFKPDWCIIDPILTIIFAVIVLATTIPILKKTLRVLLEATPSDINYLEVKNAFLPIKGIRQVHSLR